MPAPRQLQRSRRSHALVSSLTAHCSLHVRTHCVGVRCLPAVDAAWRVHAWCIICASLRCVGTWACAWGQESRGVVGLSGIARVLRLCVAGNCRLVRESVFLNTPNHWDDVAQLALQARAWAVLKSTWHQVRPYRRSAESQHGLQYSGWQEGRYQHTTARRASPVGSANICRWSVSGSWACWPIQY